MESKKEIYKNNSPKVRVFTDEVRTFLYERLTGERIGTYHRDILTVLQEPDVIEAITDEHFSNNPEPNGRP